MLSVLLSLCISDGRQDMAPVRYITHMLWNKKIKLSPWLIVFVFHVEGIRV
jgi:hypothetical protein